MALNLISHFLNNFGSKEFNGASRQDKDTQSGLQNAIDKGRKVTVNNAQSSRWAYDMGHNNDTSYEVADEDIKNGNMDADTLEHSVSSTAIDSYTYDPNTGDLDITFTSGGTYNFPNVPADVVKEFSEAPSKGQAYHQLIAPYSTERG